MNQTPPFQKENFFKLPSKKNLFLLLFFLATIVFVSLISVVLICPLTRNQFEPKTQEKTLDKKNEVQSPSLNPISLSWKSYTIDSFSNPDDSAGWHENLVFDYPNGWHLARLSPGFYQKPYEKPEDNDSKIIIDDWPIVLLYGQLPKSAVVINDHCTTACYPSRDKCEELLQKHMSEFKEWLKNYQEEVFKTEIGNIYHLSYTEPFSFDQLKPLERYYFMTPPNLIAVDCWHLYYVQTYSPEKSSILKEIVNSFRIETEERPR